MPAPKTRELNREFGRIALIAAVRRARSPGTKFDPIIVLEGPMGTNKSKAIEIACRCREFQRPVDFRRARPGATRAPRRHLALRDRRALQHPTRPKSSTSKRLPRGHIDRARPAYGRTRVDQPRRCVLFATTNNDRYLKEADRRFWPVKTGSIDIEALRRDRDQLWAEAAQQEGEGASIILRHELWEAARTEQQAREEYDPWDDVLVDVIGTIEQGEERISSTDLLSIVLKIDISKQHDFDYKRLGRCMRRLGWKGPDKTIIAGKQVKGYRRPKPTE